MPEQVGRGRRRVLCDECRARLQREADAKRNVARSRNHARARAEAAKRPNPAMGGVPGHAITDVIVRTRTTEVPIGTDPLRVAAERAFVAPSRAALVELAAVAVAWADRI